MLPLLSSKLGVYLHHVQYIHASQAALSFNSWNGTSSFVYKAIIGQLSIYVCVHVLCVCVYECM